MTLRVGLLTGAHEQTRYHEAIARACADLALDVELTTTADPGCRFVVYTPHSDWQDFSVFTDLLAVQSLWAGVERIVDNPTLTAPLLRMVDPGLTAGMREYVLAHVLRYHLDMDRHVHNRQGLWLDDMPAPPLAAQRRVGVLGLGALGAPAAQALAGLGFEVHGWRQRPQALDGIQCYFGEAGLEAKLPLCEILVLLLPRTPATDNLLDARRLSLLPRGARLINPARGTLIEDDALLAALQRGQIAHATLDVFREEPLPPSHPFAGHPQMTITPHIASQTRPETAACVVADNIRRALAGEALLHVVDRHAGY